MNFTQVGSCRFPRFRPWMAKVAVLFYLLSAPAFAEDLLSDDDFSFSAQATDESSWPDGLELSAQHLVTQGKKTQAQRSSIGLQYESALWKGSYFRIENHYRYYWRGDTLAQRPGREEPYGRNKLSQFWLQQSTRDCFLKAGRQTLFWGAVEGTFAVDQVTPFDFTESLFTDYANISRAQDMIRGECFYERSTWQAFLTPQATLSRVRHRDTEVLDDAEDSLNEEFGLAFQQRFEGLDFSLMYARLYADLPSTIISQSFPPMLYQSVSRYDLFGLSIVKALGRLLLEMDLGYQRDQLISISGQQENQLEIALGFEYTTSGNHQLNGGLWRYQLDNVQIKSGATPSLTPGTQHATQLTAGWSKNYLNDNLTMSLLGSWLTKQDQSRLTVHGSFQIDDYWQVSSALAYTEQGNLIQSPLLIDGWEASMEIKLEI